MKRVTLFIVAALLLHGSAAAGCGKDAKTIFSCIGSSGRTIEVCDRKNTIVYTFGKKDERPEILVSAPRGETSTYQWKGIGRVRTYAVSVPDGATTYRVFFSWDSLAPNAEPEAGVEVQRDTTTIATVTCAKNHKILQELEGIDLRPEN
jgi:hypothetical protein